MRRILISLLSVFILLLSGCGEGRIPAWLRFWQRKAVEVEKEPEVKEVKEEVEGTVLVSVNGRIITLEDFNARVQALNAEIKASPDIPDDQLIRTAEDKKRLLDGVIERELLIAEAIERGLDKDKELLKVIKALKEQMLVAELIELEKAKIEVTTKEIEDYYELFRDAFIVPGERRVSVIVVPTEAQARELLILLLQGSDFAALARTHSTDESASRGGDIGFIVRQTPFPQPGKKTMFKKFEEVTFALELGQPSTIFRGADGFYIVKVTEIKQERQMFLAEVFDDIKQGLLLRKQDDALRSLIANLRRDSNIITYDALLRD